LGRCRVPEKQKEVVVLSAGNFNSYLTWWHGTVSILSTSFLIKQKNHGQKVNLVHLTNYKVSRFYTKIDNIFAKCVAQCVLIWWTTLTTSEKIINTFIVVLWLSLEFHQVVSLRILVLLKWRWILKYDEADKNRFFYYRSDHL
jgi:hypothetical protein